MTTIPLSQQYAACIGIDWAHQSHAIALLDNATNITEDDTLQATPNAIDAWVRKLRTRFQDKPIAICVELSKGALVDQLTAFDFIHLYPLNPVTSARFRKAFTPSGAKDDPADARTHLNILLHHRDSLRPWKPTQPEDRRLQILTQHRRKLVSLQVDLRNQLASALQDYFPLALQVAGNDLATPMACAFLLKWTDLRSLQRAKPETVRAFYYAQSCRRGDLIEKRLKAINEAKPVSEDPALIEPYALFVQSLAKQLQALQKSIAQLEKQLTKAFDAHQDQAIWQSFPGAGAVLAPRLAIAWTSDRNRFESAQAMQEYSGIAPVRNASGKRETIYRRYHRPKFVHQTFWEYAKLSTLYCDWARAYVDAQVKRGTRRSTAYRSLAFKWQRIMHACWRTGTPYDDSRYQKTLKKRGSTYAVNEDQQAA